MVTIQTKKQSLEVLFYHEMGNIGYSSLLENLAVLIGFRERAENYCQSMSYKRMGITG